MTPQERARRAAEAMWASMRRRNGSGSGWTAVGPGHARMSCTVRDDHLNGHGICHGGVIFTLADSAFAFACNSHNRVAVAQHNSISYLSPGSRRRP
jgi:acyl-CoA thioesterase